jgi:subtilisin-like proprotein convertase family protein
MNGQTWRLSLSAGLALTAVLASTIPASALTGQTDNWDGIVVPGGQATYTEGHATPYPGTIEIQDMFAPVRTVEIELHGITHTYLADLDVLLVGPNGAAVMLMSDAGVTNPPLPATLDVTIKDGPYGTMSEEFGPADGAVYNPTNHTGNDGPADSMPTGVADPPPAGPYGTSMSAFAGIDPNGTWKLYVDDDQGDDVGDMVGWTLRIQAGPTALTDRFVDDIGNVHEGNINFIATYALTQGGPGGRPANEYGPSLPVTRAQMATFVARLVEQTGLTLPSVVPDYFDDDEGSVHELRINQMAHLGVIGGNGESGRIFHPAGQTRRDHMASFMVNAWELSTGMTAMLPIGTDEFTDDDGNPYEFEINWLAHSDIVRGIGGGLYDPSGGVRRDSMASYFARMLNKFIERGDVPGLA